MLSRALVAIMVVGSLGAVSVDSFPAEPQVTRQDLVLSPEVLKLLRAEMVEIAGGVPGIALSLASADWKFIQETSRKIRDSYVMEKKLTVAQAEELERMLPEHFKQLDSAFHQRADKLGQAAAIHDPELVAFQYSRMLESCAVCHSAYAKSRFPGFAASDRQGHQH